jgi:hypothetical protein
MLQSVSKLVFDEKLPKNSSTYHLRPHTAEKRVADFRAQLFLASHFDQLYCPINVRIPRHSIRPFRSDSLFLVSSI